MNSRQSCPRFRRYFGRVVSSLQFVLLAILQSSASFASEDVRRDGDWIVQDKEVVRDKHIRLNGSLILPAGSSLTLENCQLEILGDYSRHHSVEWKGGTLITKNCEIGGFVNDSGTAIHNVFHLYDGLWEATDTTVSYSYGISFHWSMGQGVLRGKRLKAGPRPDAIILSGQADVELVDSDFPIGLGVYCDKGGQTELKLLPGDSITASYDSSNLLPGVNWKLNMTNTRVERWFLFLRQIGGWQPPAEVTLVDSKDLIVSLFNHNLKGEVTLTNDLSQPLQMGNLTLRRASDKSAGISMFAMYFSGDETDATIKGRTHICEWMQSGGTVRVRGLGKAQDLTFGCTTLELSGKSLLLADRVLFGRPLTWQPENNIGEANVKDDSKLIARDIAINGVRFRTEGKGTVDVRGFAKHGNVEQQQDGGTIQIIEASDSARTTRPKVWIYTDMSDPTLKGSNHRGTINDPDDVSAMAGYLLMASQFETLGIVVASTHRAEHRSSPNQADWANRLFGEAYRSDVKHLNQHIGGYPEDIQFVQSCIKETSQRFVATNDYRSLDQYPTVQTLLNQTKILSDGDLINVLCWGSLTEPAILVAHCIQSDQTDMLKRLKFVAHWTNSPLHQGSPEHPEDVANCREDATACAWLKRRAAAGKITYYECGAIGQHGIVTGGPKGKPYFDQFRTSRLGTIFVEGKYVQDGVDHSDSATYWTLLADWGVRLEDIAADGTNDATVESRNEATFRKSSQRIHDELLRRSRAASAKNE